MSGLGGSNVPIKITINGKTATATKGKNELELMLADGLARSALDAILDEIGPIRSTTRFEESQRTTLHVIGRDLERT